MGLLNTLQTILNVMEEKPEVHTALEPIVLQAIHHIYENSIMEFYEEVFKKEMVTRVTFINLDSHPE